MEQLAPETCLRFRDIQLYNQFLDKRHCDIVLQIENHNIPAHSCVLAAASQKLDDMISQCESDKPIKDGLRGLKLDELTLSAFNFLIPFIYKGALNLDDLQPTNYKDVLCAAEYYGLEQVVTRLKKLQNVPVELDDDVNALFGNLADNNCSLLKQIVTDCFGDAFGTLHQVNCMLCSEKLKLNDVDQVIQHCWQHKLTANGVTEVLEDVNNDEDDFSIRGSERLQLNIEISDDYKIVDVDEDEMYSDDDDIMYDDYDLDNDVHVNERSARSENSLYNGHFNLRPTIKAKRKYEYEGGRSSKRKCFSSDYPCPLCNKLFKYSKALDSHLKFCKAAHDFSGSDPEKRALTKKGLIENIMSGKYEFSNDEEKTSMLEFLTSNQPKEKKTWQCPICTELVFHNKHDQVNHIKHVHGQIKRFVCQKCGKPFPTKTALDSHFRRHTGEKPFVCDTCGQYFAEKKSMEDHLRRHTGERPFLCTICGRDFTFRQSLYRHMKFHEGKRPYRCTVCDKAFVLKQNLQDHMQRHNKSKQTFKCPECNQVFPDEQSLANHDHDTRFHSLRTIENVTHEHIVHEDSMSVPTPSSRVEVSVGHGAEVVETNVIMQDSDEGGRGIKSEFVMPDYDDDEDTILEYN